MFVAPDLLGFLNALVSPFAAFHSTLSNLSNELPASLDP